MDKKTIGQILRDAEKKWQNAYEERGAYDPNWREPCSEYAASAVWDEAVEACISEIKNQIAGFSSEEYATGQPHSSFGERFACKSCIEALRSLKRSDKESGNG